MSKNNLFKLLFVSLFAFAATAFTGCTDDNDDVVAPVLTAQTTALQFDAEDGAKTVAIEANCEWTVEASTLEGWAEVSPLRGSGNATLTVRPVGEITANKQGVIAFTLIHPQYGKWGQSETKITVVRYVGEAPGPDPVETEVIYNETFGSGECKNAEGKWLYLDQYTAYQTTGTGAANVTYKGQGSSIRNSGLASTGYEGCSGPNHVWLGSGTPYAMIQNIALNGKANLRLTMGASYGIKDDTTGEYDNEWKEGKFHIYLGSSENSWTEVSYEIVKGTNDTKWWGFITADFTLTAVPENLFIKISSDVASAIKFDDVTLQTGIGGQSITLEGGDTPTPPTPGDEISTTFDFSAQGWANQQEVATLTQDGVTLTFDAGGNPTTPKFYTTGNALRLYAQNTMKITGSKLKKVELVFSDTDKQNGNDNEISTDAPTYTEPVWEGDANELTFTIAATKSDGKQGGHRRIVKVIVNGGSGDTPTPPTPPTPGNYTFKKVTTVTSGKQYLFVADGKKAKAVDASYNYGYLKVDDVTDNNGVITQTSLDDAFTVKQESAGYTIMQADGRYFYQSGTYTSYNVSATPSEGQYFSFEPQSDGTFKITNLNVNKYLQYDPNHTSYGSYDASDVRGPLPALYELTSEGGDEPTPPTPATPSVTTAAYSGLTASSVVLGGSYADFASAPAEVGVEYVLFTSGTVDMLDWTKAEKVAAAAVASPFTVNVSNLTAETQYAYRAYADNVYGPVMTFVTEKAGDTPVVPGDAVTIDFTAQGYADQQEAGPITQDGISITFDKGGNSNGYKWFNNGSSLRLYANNTMTVSGASLKKIELVFAETDKSNGNDNEISTDAPTYTEPTWTGDAASVTFTIAGTKSDGKTGGHRRIIKVIVNGEGGGSIGGGDEPTPPTPPTPPVTGGSSVELTLADITSMVGSLNNQYGDIKDHKAADGSMWNGFVAGNTTRLQLGWNTNPEKNAAKSYLLTPVLSGNATKVTVTPEAGTTDNRVVAALPIDFEYTGQTADEVKALAYGYTENTVKGSTEPLTIDLTGKNVKQFKIRAIGGAVYLTGVKVEHE